MPRQSPRLVTKLKMPPRPARVARIPVLDRGILDLGVVEGDKLHHRGMQLVLVAHRRGAAFEIAHIGALVGDDQRALELAGIALVDAEIGRQLHRAAHARRHIDERAVGEHRRIERGEEIVADRHDRAEIFLHQLGMLVHRFRDRHEQHAGLGQLGLEGGGDGNGIEHRIDRDPAIAVAALAPLTFLARLVCGLLDAEQRLALAQRNAELLVGAQNFRIDLVERLRRRLRRGIVIDVLIVDRAVFDLGPFRLMHGEPAAIRIEPPVQHPFRLVLLCRDEADGVFGKAFRRLLGFDLGLESILILVDVDPADLVHRLLHCRHSSLRSRFQGPRVGCVRMVRCAFVSVHPFQPFESFKRLRNPSFIEPFRQLCPAP